MFNQPKIHSISIVLSAVCLWNACAPKSFQSQMIPDATLPVNSVVTNDGNIQVITGGTTAGTNLFHSFSLVMDDGSLFSATDPQAPPLLTVNVPVGLQFGDNPGAIVNQSQVTNTEGTVTGLAVTPGQTLGLVGGQLTMDGGQVTAPQGQIYLVAVDSRNRVSGTVNN